MSDYFDITEWFDEQKLGELARKIAKWANASCSVAVGVSDLQFNKIDEITLSARRLESPLIVSVGSDGDVARISSDMRAIEYINDAALMYAPGAVLDYDVQKSPVLTFSIESDESYYGALFVTIIFDRPTSDLVCQLQLVDLIEEELDSCMMDESASRPPEEDPYVAWYYGTLFGDVVLSTQEE